MYFLKSNRARQASSCSQMRAVLFSRQTVRHSLLIFRKSVKRLFSQLRGVIEVTPLLCDYK